MGDIFDNITLLITGELVFLEMQYRAGCSTTLINSDYWMPASCKATIEVMKEQYIRQKILKINLPTVKLVAHLS